MTNQYYMIERRPLREEPSTWQLRDITKYYSTSEAKHEANVLSKNWAGRFEFRIVTVTQEIFEGY